MVAKMIQKDEVKGMDFEKIEQKWQKKWEESKIFEVKEDSGKKKYCVIEMYPYPSASGLHMGHAFNYVIGDVYSRFRKMQGFNVLHPMGYDSFGLPAENAAIKEGVHPKPYTEKAMKNFMIQQKALGLSYDWTRLVYSHNPEYYKWNQFFFLQFLKNGLAYRKKSPVNWCPKCNSVLANEQVHQGKCWRHKDTDVEIRPLEQWFVNTSKYSDELLEGVEKLNWPERIKAMQRNWIGRSEGSEILFSVNGENWPIFTTRADTIFGVTFLVVSAQHPRLNELVTREQKKEVEAFLKKIKSTSEKDATELEKEGAFTGSYAVNPMTGEKVPIWTGNFVVADYGSGMVMAVPAHDARDFEFAKKYRIPIKQVIEQKGGKKQMGELKNAFTEDGVLVNSEQFSGMSSSKARDEITSFLESKKLGGKTINYKLRDWLISRQRYWGTPIPIVYCEKCGAVPVPENELPVELPEKVKFGEGNPLTTNADFVNAKCPRCGGKGRRETDTMDTFFDSSWYYLRYCDAKNNKEAFERKKVDYWMPVDFYTGGAEHACMHLIYGRFFTKALRDLGYLKFDEPFLTLFNQGMIHGEDGAVMSKSRGNVVDPLNVIKEYGADSLRMFLVSMSSPDKDSMWSSTGLDSVNKFVSKVYEYFGKNKFTKSSARVEHKINKGIKEISQDIEKLQYNLAVIKLRMLFDSLEEDISKKDAESFVKMFAVFCPHVSEEIWEMMGEKGFISSASWPVADESKIDEKLEEQEKAFEKTVADVMNVLKIVKEKSGNEAEKVYLYVISNELVRYDEYKLSKRIGKEVKVFAVNDKNKYDPEGKAGKAKPGKPGLFVE